jgi:vacuolar-type H+-ATPase subunit E/Vma4
VTVGWAELLQVLGEEAAREARLAREAATAEAARILTEARTTAEAARRSLDAREAEAEGQRWAGLDSEAALVRSRARLLARRSLAGELRAEVVRRLAAVTVDDAALARLLAELLAEAPPGPFTLTTDPGEAERVRAALATGHPGRLADATVEEAASRRGGVELRSGRLWLDDTLPARLERAWPELEWPLLRSLIGEER